MQKELISKITNEKKDKAYLSIEILRTPEYMNFRDNLNFFLGTRLLSLHSLLYLF